MSFRDQLSANSLVLKVDIDRKIGQVCAEREVGDCSRDTDQPTGRASSQDQIRMPQHTGDPQWIVNRSSLCECRTAEDVDELVNAKVWLAGIIDRHGGFA